MIYITDIEIYLIDVILLRRVTIITSPCHFELDVTKCAQLSAQQPEYPRTLIQHFLPIAV